MDTQYKKRSELIYVLLQNKYSDLDITFYFNEESSYYELYIENFNSTTTILPDIKFKEIELIISKKRTNRNDEFCSICEKESKQKTSCSKCGENWCIQCYCDILEFGKGIMKCPYCRYQWGEKVKSKHIIQSMIEQIKSNCI
jgi:hypothetical protein